MRWAAVRQSVGHDRIRSGLVCGWLCLVCAGGMAAFAEEIVENSDHAGPKTTIRYAMWGGATEVLYAREICASFVKKHPDIRVSVGVYPWGQYWAKLQTQAASGLAPDVISLYAEAMGVWIARGALLPLDDFVTSSGLDLSQYHRAAIENCRWEGRLYSMPMEIPLRTVIYCIDRFEQSGIPREQWPRPDRAMTWEEFKSLAARLTLRKPDGSFLQYGMAGTNRWNRVMARMYGGDFTDRQVDPTRATVTGNAALERALTEIFQTQYGDRISLGAVPLSAGAFLNDSVIVLSGKFAMGMSGPWALPALKEAGLRFGLTPMPRGPRPSQLVGLNSVGIWSASKHPAAAWKFLEHTGSIEVQSIYGRRLKGVPALIAAKDSFIHNDYGIEGCEAYLFDLPIAAPDLTSSNSYLDSAILKWFSQTETALNAEYDRRLAALPRDKGRIVEAGRKAFVEGMNRFVEQTIAKRLPTLQEDLERSFTLAARPKPGRFVKVTLPMILATALLVFFVLYVRFVRSHRAPSPSIARRETNLAGYLFIAPWLIGLACFVIGPILAAVVLSFTDWNMIRPPEWIGARNFLDLPGDQRFAIGLRRTFLYAALVIPISLAGGLFTAGLLTCDIRGRDAFKAIFYFPSLFTGAAAAVLWVNMFNKEYGVVNRALSFLGIAAVNWLDEGHAFGTVVLMNVFWIGGAMIIYYAGMKQIPASLYEAADIDGAGPVRKFLFITIPMLSPVILFMVVMTTIGAFQVFTPALFFAESSSVIGQPGDALRFYSVNVFDEAFNNLRMGRACAYAVVLFVIIFAVTMVQVRLSRRFVHTENE